MGDYFAAFEQCMWRKLLCESHPEIFAAFLGLVGVAGFGFFRSLFGFVLFIFGVRLRVVNIFCSGMVFTSFTFEVGS